MTSRIARACEQCRKSKRRCKPPYPCVNCLSAGTSCEVREKARPHRKRNQSLCPPRATSKPRIESPEQLRSPPSTGASSLPELFTDSDEVSRSKPPPEVIKTDTFVLVRGVVARYAKSCYGYELKCDLPEPKQSLSSIVHDEDGSPANYADSLTICLDKDQISSLITTLCERWTPHPRVVSIEHLNNIVERLVIQLYPQNSIELSSTYLTHSGLPLDSLALLFAGLALGSYFTQDFSQARRLFVDSTDLFAKYTGPPSFDSVAALFFQHLFAIREGSANQAKSLNVQAIHVAHELGMNKAEHISPDLDRVELYLLLYFADQYSATSHNTPPTIKTNDYHPDLFEPLARAHPQLRTFIELIKLNGHIFEHVYGLRCTGMHVCRLEHMIGKVCEATGRPLQSSPEREASEYDVLVQIHMFWCRLMLRAPSMSSSTYWVSSLSICVRAAQMLLSIYLRIYRPEIRNASNPMEQVMSSTPSQSLQIDNSMPPTWRQVKRITTAAFVIVYAYWRGEASADETSRFLAMALLLLHCQCIRWRHELAEAMDTLRDLVELSALSIAPALSILLPGTTLDFITSMISASSSYTEVCVRVQKEGDTINGLNLEQVETVGDYPQFEDFVDKSMGSFNNDPSNFLDYESWLPTPLVGLFGDVQ